MIRPYIGRLKSLVFEAKNKLASPFYLRPQTYIVRYRANVLNKSAVENAISVVAPIPPSTPSQKVQSKIVFTPIPRDKDEEVVYKNQYVLWHDTLKPEESQEYEVIFSAEVSPIKVDLARRFTLNHYTQNGTYDRYVKSNKFVSGTQEQVKKIAFDIKRDDTDVINIARKFHNYVISNLEYGNQITGLYSVENTLKTQCVDCGGYSALFVSLCMAVGIPARIVSGFWAGYPENMMHAWAEFLLPNGEWVPVDTSVKYLTSQGRSKRYGGFGYIGSDRIVVSYGCDISIKLGERDITTDILQHPFIFSVQPVTSFAYTLKVETDIKQ